MSNKYKGKKRMETSSQGWENGTTLFGRLAVSQNRVLGKYMCVKGQESQEGSEACEPFGVLPLSGVTSVIPAIFLDFLAFRDHSLLPSVHLTIPQQP